MGGSDAQRMLLPAAQIMYMATLQLGLQPLLTKHLQLCAARSSVATLGCVANSRWASASADAVHVFTTSTHVSAASSPPHSNLTSSGTSSHGVAAQPRQLVHPSSKL